jgi:hypothetical protein
VLAACETGHVLYSTVPHSCIQVLLIRTRMRFTFQCVSMMPPPLSCGFVVSWISPAMCRYCIGGNVHTCNANSRSATSLSGDPQIPKQSHDSRNLKPSMLMLTLTGTVQTRFGA